MDKYEYKLRSEEIEKLMDNHKYADAALIADTINWNRVKKAVTLQRIAELYKLNKRFEDCRNILLMAYERNPGSRNVVYALCEISLEFGDIVQAVEYFKEFAKLAPRDIGVYTLRYRIYEAQNVGLEDRIELLEELKKKDRLEEWEYELAYLYHRVGLATKCVEECDEIILWFGEGPYVVKAMELKMLHEPLTPAQKEKYDKRNELKIRNAAENAPSLEEEELDFRVKTMDMSKYNTINLQEELAKNLKDYIDDDDVITEPIAPTKENQIVYHNTIPADNQEIFFEDKTEDMRFALPTPKEADNSNPQLQEWKDNFSQQITEMETPQSFGQLTGEDTVTMETMPIAGNAEEFHKSLQTSTANKTEGIKATILPDGTTVTGMQAIPPVAVQQPIVSQDTFRGRDMQEIYAKDEKETPDMAVKMMNQSSDFDDMLTQGSDGQISLVVPETEKRVEKQITGQLNIADILADWERLKKENEQKMQEEVRRRVLDQTGEIFSQFDEVSKTGILATLENPEAEIVQETVSETVMKGLEATDVVPEAVVEEIAATAVATEAAAAVDEVSLEENAAGTSSLTGSIPGAIWDEVEKAKAMDNEGLSVVSLESTDELLDEESSEEENISEETDTAEKEEPEEPEEETTQTNIEQRELTAEERALFGSYFYSKKMKKQIIAALEKMSLASYVGNVLITGDAGSGVANLAKNLVRYVQIQDSNFSGNVAKISAENLNKKDIPGTLTKLANGALIVERASTLTMDSVKTMLQTLNQEGNGIIIILLDRKKDLQRFLDAAPVMKDFFDVRIDVVAMTTDMLVEYGIRYAYDKEYSVDDLGRLALYKRISELQNGNHSVTASEVKKIVDAAIKHANRKSLSAFASLIARKRYDEEDMIILKEKDFDE